MQEKRRLLNLVFSNSTWKAGHLTPKYRKPFDLLAVTNIAYKKEKATSPRKSDDFDIWLPIVAYSGPNCPLIPHEGVHRFRTKLSTHSGGSCPLIPG